MTSTPTKIADVIVPEIFTPYAQNITTEKSLLVQSGVLARDAELDRLLAGGGLTFNSPSFKDLANDEERVGTDDDTQHAEHKKIGTLSEIQVRMNRNQSWSSMTLAAALAGADPQAAIASRVGAYWERRLQVAWLSALMGVFADNEAAPDATEHVQNDLTHDIKGGSYSAGVTTFNTEAFIDALTLMGDSQEGLGLILTHSVVYARMRKNNLIDFIPDARGEVDLPFFLGRRVIVDDGAPNPAGSGAADTAAGIYHTLIVGQGAFRLGVGTPDQATEVERIPGSGNGQGQDVLYNRVEWCIHPVGYQFAVASPANGGPSNAATSGNLAHAASWKRAFPERKQIKIARLITRESA